MKTRSSYYILPAMLSGMFAMAFTACESDDNVGSIIAEDEIQIIIDEYNLGKQYTGLSKIAESSPITSVASRTSSQLLGRIDAEGFGQVSSEYVAQFMPANQLSDQLGPDNIDSLKLRMFMTEGSYVGDTLVPMGLQVFRLTRDLPYPISSDFSPEGYYDKTPIATTIYNASIIGWPDSIAEDYTSNSVRVVDINLPVELGRDFYNKYLSEGGKQLFNSPTLFSDWFKGIYVKNTYGSGRIMSFYATRMYMYLSRHETLDNGNDTTYNYVNAFLAITPEVINNNNISQTLSPQIISTAESQPVIVAPTGYEVNINLPIEDIIDKYHQSKGQNTVLNAMTLKLSAEEIENKYGIAAPPYLLLVKKSKRDEFFADNMLTNDTTSFYTAFNTDSCTYTFSSMRNYLLEMIKKVDAGQQLTAEDSEFVLTPVSIQTETNNSSYTPTTTVVAIVPYIQTPAMAKINLDKSKITVTYSNQNLNNY